jgi:hypothetical protein
VNIVASLLSALSYAVLFVALALAVEDEQELMDDSTHDPAVA